MVSQLSTMSRAEKDLAIARLRAAPDSIHVMPPVTRGVLSAEEIEAAAAALAR